MIQTFRVYATTYSPNWILDILWTDFDSGLTVENYEHLVSMATGAARWEMYMQEAVATYTYDYI